MLSYCFVQGKKDDNGLEIETWYDLALLYLGMAQWRDAEVCVLKIRSISPCSALAWHATGDSCSFLIAAFFILFSLRP
jgi:ATP-dependent RNA helicase DHX36